MNSNDNASRPSEPENSETTTNHGYIAFPLDALPPVLREMVQETAASLGCDPALAALPALTLAGACIGAAVRILPKCGWAQSPSLWCCTVSDSGTGKSPAAKPFSDLAFAIDSEMRKDHKRQVAKWMAEKNRKSESADGSTGNGKASKAEQATPSPQRQFFAVSDFSIERLAEIVTDSPRGVVMVRDELAGWFGSFTRYKGKGGGSDVPNWLSLFDCGPLRVHRRSAEPRDIETDSSFVAVFGGIQPEILKKVFSDPGYVESGLAARIVFASPPKKCLRWSDDEIAPGTHARFAEILKALRSIPLNPENPADLPLEPAALDRFKALMNEFADRAEGLDGGPMSAVLPKALQYTLRLALINHCVSMVASGQSIVGSRVGESSIMAGVNMARWFVHEAERVYDTFSETPEERDTRNLLDLINRKGGRITSRALQNADGRKYKKAGVAEAALNALVKGGHGQWKDRAPGKEGGCPTKDFVANFPKQPGGEGVTKE